MRDAIELSADRVVDLALLVAEDVAPERRDAVEVAAAIDVDQVIAFAALDQQRLFLAIDGVRRERMPEMGVVDRLQLLARPSHHSTAPTKPASRIII